MVQNNNGFVDMQEHLGVLSNVSKKVTLESLEAAANFYVAKLLPNIPRSLLNKKHMADHVKVVVENEQVVVYFENTSFYWRFAENGTKQQKAQHFASGTWEQYQNQIETIMTEQIIKEMEG